MKIQERMVQYYIMLMQERLFLVALMDYLSMTKIPEQLYSR